MLSHLAHMERRWFVWGFLGEQVDDPWGDDRDDRWHVPDDVDRRRRGRRCCGAWGSGRRDVLASHALDEAGTARRRGSREEPPTLAWICFHVLQEYARHAGHLDVAVELGRRPDVGE